MMPAEFEIENGVLLKYHGARADVTVPEGVTQIGKDAFHDCWTLRSVFIPDGVTQIGAGAFENSTVTSIRLPEDLIKIGAYAFHRCSHLTSVVVPQGVREIESNTFGFCSALVSVVIPNGVTKIGRDAFYFCEKLSSFPIPEGLTEIGEQLPHRVRQLLRRDLIDRALRGLVVPRHAVRAPCLGFLPRRPEHAFRSALGDEPDARQGLFERLAHGIRHARHVPHLADALEHERFAHGSLHDDQIIQLLAELHPRVWILDPRGLVAGRSLPRLVGAVRDRRSVGGRRWNAVPTG